MYLTRFSALVLVTILTLFDSSNRIISANNRSSQAIASTKNTASKSKKSILYPIVVNVKEGNKTIEKWGYIDRTSKVVVKPQYDYAQAMYDDLARVRSGRNNGALDRTGKIVVPINFADVTELLNEGLVMVLLNADRPRLCSVDISSGKITLPDLCGRGQGALFRNGLAPIQADKGKFGYIDRSGKFIIQPQFEGASNFSDGLAAVTVDGKWSYIDLTGKIVIEPKLIAGHGPSGFFKNGLGPVKDLKTLKSGYIDRTGKLVIPAQFDEGREFEGDIAVVKINGKANVIDRAGKIITKNGFDSIGFYHEDLAEIEIGNKSGYIDRQGKIAIAPEYDAVERFSEGLAAVKKGGKWGYIDRTGKVVIPFNLQSSGRFRDGIAGVESENKPIAYIDSKGRYIWRAEP